MSTNTANVTFHSPLAPLLKQFIQEKRACGYRYDGPARLLALFDQHLCSEAPAPATLPRSVTSGWIAKRPHESAATHQHRVSIVRQFALFMGRLGHAADVPSGSLAMKNSADFIPRILTRAEVQRVLHAVDGLTPTAHSPLRHLIMPEVFRLLYGCGFRLNEVLHLRVADVDLNRGVLTVREGKFGKDRLVPPTVALVQRLQHYDAGFGRRRADAFFFPSREDAAWCIAGSATCYCNAGSLTVDVAKGPDSTICVTRSQSILWCAGIEKAPISTPSYRCWRPTWAISLYLGRSAICI